MPEQQSEIEPYTPPRRLARVVRARAPVVLAVAAGGALGAAVRYEITAHANVAPDSFPWPTFESVRLFEDGSRYESLLNAIGSLAAGLAAAAIGLALAAMT